MQPLRLFIAVELPLPLLEKVHRALEPLRRNLPAEVMRWVPYQNIHLTLKFLGDVSPSNVELLSQAMFQEAARHPPFEAILEGWGVFPDLKRPRVLWLGVSAPPRLLQLQRGLDLATQRLGYVNEERSFTPHLTIGRLRSQLGAEDFARVRTALQQFTFPLRESFAVTAVHLFRSELTPQGAIYTRLFTAPLSYKEVPSEST